MPTRTAIDNSGIPIIDSKAVSVVYESYSILDEDPLSAVSNIVMAFKEGRRPPGDFRRPPGDFKRPPGSFRRPPGSFKRPPGDFKMMATNMNIFLSRFMKIKNVQSSWNETGFTSTHVKFVTVEPSGTNAPTPYRTTRSNESPKKMEILIPRAEPIQVTLEEISAMLLDNKHMKSMGFDSNKVAFLHDNIKSLDLAVPSNAELVRRLSRLLKIGKNRE